MTEKRKEQNPLSAWARDILSASREGVICMADNELSEFIRIEGIARKYFNETGGWLSDRLKGNFLRDSERGFTDEETLVLASAFKDLAEKLNTYAHKIESTPRYEDDGEEHPEE